MWWPVHTLANALPAGIFAIHVLGVRGEGIAGMAAVVLLYVLVVPVTPLRKFFLSPGAWGRAFRMALWIRTVWSLYVVPLIFLAQARPAWPLKCELWIGAASARSLSSGLRLLGIGHKRIPPDWGEPALLAFAMGTAILIIIGMITFFIWCVLTGRERK